MHLAHICSLFSKQIPPEQKYIFIPVINSLPHITAHWTSITCPIYGSLRFLGKTHRRSHVSVKITRLGHKARTPLPSPLLSFYLLSREIPTDSEAAPSYLYSWLNCTRKPPRRNVLVIDRRN